MAMVPKRQRARSKKRASRPFEIGDWVKFEAPPPWTTRLPSESQQLIEFCTGKAFRIDEIRADGLLVLDVSWHADDHFGGSFHDLRVEPEHVVRAEPRESEVAHRAIAGTWRIIQMDEWSQDAVDLVVPGYIRFAERSRSGDFRFIAVEGATDSFFRIRDGRPFAEFSWLGEDDGDPKNGRGWAMLTTEAELRGHIFFHQGMDSGFVAQRYTETEEPRLRKRARRRR